MCTRTWTLRMLVCPVPLVIYILIFVIGLMPTLRVIKSMEKPVGFYFSIRQDFFQSCATDKDAINKLSPGDAVIIFTPDSMYQLFLPSKLINNLVPGALRRHALSYRSLCYRARPTRTSHQTSNSTPNTPPRSRGGSQKAQRRLLCRAS